MEPQDFLQEYVEEVREHLQELEKSLLTLEREGTKQDEISQLFRAAHSIKGASAYMGFEQIAHLTHELESLFSEVQSSSLEVTPRGISTLLACVDYIANAVGQLQDSGAEPSVPASLLDALQTIRSTESGPDLEEPSVPGGSDENLDDFEVDFSAVLFPDMPESLQEGHEEESVPPCPSSVSLQEESSGELEEEDAELLTIFIGSFKESIDQVCSALASPADSPLSEKEFQQIHGILRRLQASCQYMDYEDVAALVLRAEEVVANGHQGSKARGVLFHEFWTLCAEPLKGHMPQLELPTYLLETVEPQPPKEELFQEDDEELLAIFVETFHQQFSELAGLSGAPEGVGMTTAALEKARQLIKKLIASSQYMDYDRVADILIEWDEKLAESIRNGVGERVLYDKLLNTYGRRLETCFPALGALVDSGERVEQSSILQYLDQEIDRSFDLFENITFGEAGEDSALQAAEPVMSSAEPPEPEESTDRDETPSEISSRRAAQSDRISAAAEEMPSSTTLRVDAQKVDQLLNQVGELVVTRSEFVQTVMTFREMLRELATQGKLSKQEIRRLRLIGFRLHESTLSLGRVANDLQDSSMRIRMLPISHLFQRFPRIARDQALRLNKKLELFIDGGETEIDKRVLEQMHDPLVQFLRNAIAHGIELPEERIRAGKPEVGTIRLAAYHEGDYVALEIEDDGCGVDTDQLKKVLQNRGEMSLAEIERLSEDDLKYAIFLPGLSTRESVDGNAGRGVGLDVVKENVERMNGTIEVFSVRGQGTRFLIRIPLTVAIIRALLVKAADQVFTLPLTAVTEILRYRREETHTIEGFEVISLRGKTIPIVHLNQLLNLPDGVDDKGSQFTIIVSTSFRDVGLVVGGLMGEREVVIKPIEDEFHAFRGFSGATVLGDGTVSLIVDVSSLLRMMRDTMGAHPAGCPEPEQRLLH
jgi:two-component system chemotaxis sensor kinase CheA